jgi:hypothetical protein
LQEYLLGDFTSGLIAAGVPLNDAGRIWSPLRKVWDLLTDDLYPVTDALWLCLLLLYGKVGGADETVSTQNWARIHELIGLWSGVWYSHYGNRKLDSYRIGQWKNRESLLTPEKRALFPGLDLDAPQKYYTETATLAEAIAKNNSDNDGEFIAWSIVIPQDREK